MEKKDKIILIVDDESINIDILRNTLQSDYKLVFAKNGEQALKRIVKKLPDLILLDIIMPGMDGYEVCKKIKDNEKTKDIPVIFITSMNEISDVTHGFNVGAVDYITKPFSEDIVKARINTHLQLRNTLVQYVDSLNKLEEAKKESEIARQIAEDATRSKSEFLANMSHELRTPLNGILGYAEIIKRKKGLDVDARSGINTIQESGKHLLTLINDILDLSKIEARKMELYPTEISLKFFLANIVGIIKMRTVKKGIQFIFNVDDDLPTGIIADEKRLRQVLLNLLGNSVKFTEKGYIRFLVKKQNNNNCPTECCSILFEVEDTGIGILHDQLISIFEPFKQVGDSNLRSIGTGLGLAISQQLVEKMGGKIQVQSEIGKGSKFGFELSLKTVSLELIKNSETNRHIIGYLGSKKKVLVIDDQKDNRELLFDLLKPLGFEVDTAKNGRDGINRALEIIPDIILIDLIMPLMTGFEVVEKIRQSKKLKNIPIIAISASAFEKDQEKSISIGCNDFLAKPIDVQYLFNLLEKNLKLKWNFENKFEEDNELNEMDESLIIAPPNDELQMLYKLAMVGKNKMIRDIANQIQKIDKRYIPFAQKIISLSKAFEDKKILEFVKKYMNL